MIKIAAAFIIIKALVSAFDYRETSPAALFPYYKAMDEPGGFYTSNPAFLPLIRNTYINASYCRPYSLVDLKSNSLRLGQGFNGLAYQLAWNSFGIDEYREDILEGNAGYSPFKFFSMGMGFSNYRLSIGTQDLSLKENLYDFRASILLNPFDWFQMGFHQDNINSLVHPEREDLLFPESSFGISLAPAGGLSLIWNINRTYYGKVNSFSISANLLYCLKLKAGYSRETFTYSGAVAFIYRKLNVSYGLRYHAYLGTTHSFSAGMSWESFSLRQINYTDGLYKKINTGRDFKRININQCDHKELKIVPGLKEEIAERIIKYREIIGPVGEKSLLQIGMTPGEIKSLKKYITGLDSGREKVKGGNNKKRVYNRKLSISKKRELFRKLLGCGISASDALQISRLAGKGSMRLVRLKIKNMEGISPGIKEKVLKACGDIL